MPMLGVRNWVVPAPGGGAHTGVIPLERITRQYLLASTTYDMEDEEVIAEPIFSFIGRPRDGGIWLSPAADVGTCPRCKSEVRGFCAHSICPVCKHYVALT